MLIILRFISLFLLAAILLMVVSAYAPFLLVPLWIAFIIALVVCLYLVLKIEIKALKKGTKKN
ncbi:MULTISPECIES: hypothetical protein [Bacillus]|uniref:hypothetical protein n=1 Tax=Bacillus TaxID=1386 RepID=UPI00040246D7|nr:MULTISPECIES: hypothetical protein [Bacillus]QHZ48650.1 hypothetical protein M654_021560 [Bacillus sp. NSP9.1]WFA05710.1 hypothetical protein P3X63_02340 [Bacillus sp. HSf4]